MWKLSDLISDDEEPGTMPVYSKELPISVHPESLWSRQENPIRFVRVFKLKDEGKYNSFVMDILEYHAECGHHGRLTMQFPKLKIEVWTHTLMDVTEIDVEYTKKVSEIFEDHQ